MDQHFLPLVLVAEDREVSEQFADSDAITGGLAAVGGTNTLLGGSERVSAVGLLSLLQAVDLLVEVKHQVSAI